MKVSYVKISTMTQNLDRQLENMRRRGVEERYIFKDIDSGKNFERPGYLAMKQVLRPGDCIYIVSLDQLGMDYEGIIEEWKYITRELQCDIVVLDNEHLFNSHKFREMGEMGKLLEDQFFSLLAYVADMEKKKRFERQRQGIENAKKKGVRFGRPVSIVDWELFDCTAKRWARNEITAAEACRITGCKKTSFYKYIKERGFEKEEQLGLF